MLIAPAPEVPGVTAHDFLRRQIDAAIHRFENVCSDLRKIGSGFSSRFCLVDWLIFSAAGKHEKRACDQAASDPGETEKIALGLEERLHRAIIDMSFAKRVARQFCKARNDGSFFVLVLVPGIEKG
jgi:hypothetical protein